MKVVVTGASGLVGSALVRNLRADGHRVVRLVRRPPASGDEARWDPAAHRIDDGALDGAEVVVHLAGAGIGDHRWTESYKRKIRDSRVDGTTTIAEAVARLTPKPRVLVCASAVGYYGDTGEDVTDEASPSGRDFLAGVVRDWETAADPARDAGVRVVHVRSGILLSNDGGLLAKMLPIFRLGLGGRLGSGRQWFSWIALPDHVAAMRLLMSREDVSGALNLTAPEPVRNREFTKSLARAVHRPAPAVVPSVALRAVFGGFADEGALVSQRVVPTRLEQIGFEFAYADVDAALRALVG